MENHALLHGDCLEILKTLPDNSVDSLVTDPPAGISFMGKDWDGDKGGRKQWIAWMTEVMAECLRVMKPGAHGLVWALPRTSHWTATALEDAGFEVRDVVTHLFGTGFPKSMNISIAIDKAAGAIGHRGKAFVAAGVGERSDIRGTTGAESFEKHEGITDAAREWSGWGTALKPASEHWILVRKPCSEKTVAANVLKWGCGGLNIDGSRINPGESVPGGGKSKRGNGYNYNDGEAPENAQPHTEGRFPANLVLDEEAAQALDAQSGTLHARGNKGAAKGGGGLYGHGKCVNSFGAGDSGGASRFFYVAKAPSSDKWGMCSTCSSGPLRNEDLAEHRDLNHDIASHPTVKSTALMGYLIRLVTPKGGVVLDPFNGSGSTGVAALAEGHRYLGIEKDEAYYAIACERLHDAEKKLALRLEQAE